MSVEWVAAMAAVACAIGTCLPVLLAWRSQTAKLAAWRAAQDAGFDNMRQDLADGLRALHKRQDRQDLRQDQADKRQGDMAKAMAELAGVAGRALGRTERD